MLLAILLALTVWIAATQEENPVEQTDFERPIPIEIVGMDSDLIIINEPPDSAIVELRAPRSTLRSLSQEDFAITADLTGLGPGVHLVPLQVEIAARAIVVASRPAQIRVELEETQQREMPIHVTTQGELPVGFRAQVAEIVPTMAIIDGPRSRVSLVSEVRASTSLAGLRDTFQGSLTLQAYDSDGNVVTHVTITPPTANVTIPIYQEEDFREVAVRVNAANVLPAPGYYISRVTADPPLVPVRGDPNVIKSLLFVETQPINLPGLKESTTINAQLVPPEGVTLEGITTVQVNIVVQAQPDFRVLEIPIQTVGLGENLAATLLPDTAVVFLSGPLPILENLDPQEEVIVTLDLSSLEPGSYQIEPEVQIVSGEIPATELQKVLIESVLPTLIQVQIGTGSPSGTP